MSIRSFAGFTFLLVAVAVMLAAFGGALDRADAAGSVTAATVKQFFDAKVVFIMFAWGLACKWLPVLKGIPNAIIPWVNLVGYIAAAFAGAAVPAASASVGSTLVSTAPDIAGILLGAFTHSIVARQLWEGFGRTLLEGMLKLKAPGSVAAPAAAG